MYALLFATNFANSEKGVVYKFSRGLPNRYMLVHGEGSDT